YDPWLGRFFLSAAVFLVPIAGMLYDREGWRRYLAAALAVGCTSAVCSALLRSETQLLSAGGHISVLRMDRVGQLTREHPGLDVSLRAFGAAVPTTARVQLTLPADSPEYLFFGERLTRDVRPRPAGAPLPAGTWLLFEEPLERHRDGDVWLGSGF